jgi:hypothetical protein
MMGKRGRDRSKIYNPYLETAVAVAVAETTCPQLDPYLRLT